MIAWLCLALLAVVCGASATDQWPPVEAGSRSVGAGGHVVSTDVSAVAIEHDAPEESAPVAVPEVATLLFLASGGALIVARHRHPRPSPVGGRSS